MQKSVFTESQQFNQWYLWLLLIGIPAGLLLGIARDLSKLELAVDSAEFWSVFAGVFLSIGMLVLFRAMRLETSITEEAVNVRFFPFHRNFIRYPWNEITAYEVRKYNGLFEYGGWGLRGFRDNRAFSVSGTIGLQLTFKNGKRLLIGTRKKAELENTLRILRNRWAEGNV